jgi:hypothetical protein
MEGVHALAGVLMLLIFWGFVGAVILVPIYLRNQDRARGGKLLHETIVAAQEKGQPVPAELIEALTDNVGTLPTRKQDLRRAIIWLAIGLGFIGLGACLGWGISFANETGGAITGGAVAGVGAIPAFIGLAYFVLWLARSGSAKS